MNTNNSPSCLFESSLGMLSLRTGLSPFGSETAPPELGSSASMRTDHVTRMPNQPSVVEQETDPLAARRGGRHSQSWALTRIRTAILAEDDVQNELFVCLFAFNELAFLAVFG